MRLFVRDMNNRFQLLLILQQWQKRETAFSDNDVYTNSTEKLQYLKYDALSFFINQSSVFWGLLDL